MNNEIDEIKNRLSIDEVISSYIKLEKAGSNLKARCPFHNEKSPSFFVSPSKGFYKCFGCGASGDIFTFVEKYEGLNFSEALKKLADKAGVQLSQKNNFKEKINYQKYYEILEEVTIFWQKKMLQNISVKNYLKKRGLISETVKKFRVGYAEDGWNKTSDFLLKKGYSYEDLEKVGLVKKNDRGGWYDRFRNRIIFPIFDLEGRVVAFSGRDFSGSDKVAKYLNSPETFLFNKSKILFGMNFAKYQGRQRNYFIVAEGQMDLLMSHQAGFENTVVTSGTSLTDEHLDLIGRYSKKIIFSFDSDTAGINATYKALVKALKKGFEIKIVDIEEGKDPADIILESENKWKNNIVNAKDWLGFLIEKIIFKNISDLEKIEEMKTKVLPFLKSISDPILKGKYVKKIADGFGVKEDFVLEELKNSEEFIFQDLEVEEDSKLDIFSKKGIIYNIKLRILREIFGIYFWQLELQKNAWLDNMEEILEIINAEKGAEKFWNLNKRQKDQLILETQVKYENSTKENLNFVLKNLLSRLKKMSLDDEIERIKKEILVLSDSKEKAEKIKLLEKLIKTKHNYD